jgi:hypothetical protein
MLRAPRKPTLILLVLLAFVAATSAFVGHVHEDPAHEHGRAQHDCELCLQLGGGIAPAGELLAAGVPAPIATRTPPRVGQQACREPKKTHPPRAPPLADFPLT